MTRVAFDSNVLLYARLEQGAEKGVSAQRLIVRATVDGVIAAQALAEYLHVAGRKAPNEIDASMALAATYAAHMLTPPTTIDTVNAAAALVRDHRLQFWDAVIIIASASVGAKVLLSEDMQDGRHVAGLRILNPFNPANAAAVDALFPV